MVNLDFLSLKSLGITNLKLDDIVDRLEKIQKLHMAIFVINMEYYGQKKIFQKVG